MQVSHTRRRWLAGLCLGALASRLPAAPLPAAAVMMSARLLGRWPTGNGELSPPTPVGDILVCSGDVTLSLIDTNTATPRWQRAHGLPGGAVFRPRVAANTLVAAGQGGLGAWRLADGAPLWRKPANIEIGTPWVDAGQICHGDGHELICRELDDGRERWRFAVEAGNKISYAPVIVADTVYVGPGDGCLYALDRLSGRPRWRIDGRQEWQYLRQLHVSGELLIAGTYTERLVALDLQNGRTRWQFNAGNFINSHHVADGAAYLWSPTGWLYALDAASGQLRWQLRTTDYRGSAGNWAAILAELASDARYLYVLDLAPQLHVIDKITGVERLGMDFPEEVRPFIVPLGEGRIACGAENGDLLLLTMRSE